MYEPTNIKTHYFTCSPLSHRASANSKKTETQSAGLSSIFLFLDLDEDPVLRTPGRLMAICNVWIASVNSPIFFLVWALIRWYNGCSRIWNGQEVMTTFGHAIPAVNQYQYCPGHAIILLVKFLIVTEITFTTDITFRSKFDQPHPAKLSLMTRTLILY